MVFTVGTYDPWYSGREHRLEPVSVRYLDCVTNRSQHSKLVVPRHSVQPLPASARTGEDGLRAPQSPYSSNSGVIGVGLKTEARALGSRTRGVLAKAMPFPSPATCAMDSGRESTAPRPHTRW